MTGETGTGKSILLSEFIYRGITAYGQPGVFIACVEPPEAIRLNVAGFGWDAPRWRAAAQGNWRFSMRRRSKGTNSLVPLVETIARTVERIKAERVRPRRPPQPVRAVPLRASRPPDASDAD